MEKGLHIKITRYMSMWHLLQHKKAKPVQAAAMHTESAFHIFLIYKKHKISRVLL